MEKYFRGIGPRCRLVVEKSHRKSKTETNLSGRSPRFPRGKSPSLPGDELYSTVSPHSREDGPSDFHYNLPSFASLEFCFLPSTGQDRGVHPGPPRLGRRHPIRRYQTTTTIANNQTQLISSSLAIRLPLPQSPGDRPQHHPSSRSRPSRTAPVRWGCPAWAGSILGKK